MTVGVVMLMWDFLSIGAGEKRAKLEIKRESPEPDVDSSSEIAETGEPGLESR